MENKNIIQKLEEKGCKIIKSKTWNKKEYDGDAEAYVSLSQAWVTMIDKNERKRFYTYKNIFDVGTVASRVKITSFEPFRTENIENVDEIDTLAKQIHKFGTVM